MSCTTAIDTIPTSYNDLVLTEFGLQHYYRLDEPAGSASAYDSKGSATGSASGVVFGSSGPLGDGHHAATFDGAHGIAVAARLLPVGDKTVEAWVKWDGGSGILGGGGWIGCLGAVGFTLCLDATGHLSFQQPGGGAGQTYTLSYALTAGVWYYIVWTYTALSPLREHLWYVNGVFVAMRQQLVTDEFDADARIGGNASFSGYFHGDLANVATYCRALTPAQIATHFAQSDDAEILRARVHRLSKYAVTESELWYYRTGECCPSLFPIQPLFGPAEGLTLTQTYKQPSTLEFVLPDPQGDYAPENRNSPYNYNDANVYDPLLDEARKIFLRVGTHCYANFAAGILPTSSLSPSAGPLSVLTDGTLGDIATSISGYVEFAPTDTTPFHIDVDLWQSRSLKHAVIRFASYIGGSTGTDFTLPSSVQVSLSADNTNWSDWPIRPVGGAGSGGVAPGDWNDSHTGQTVEIAFVDFDHAARYVRFTITPDGAQTLGLDQLAIYGGNQFRVLGENLFTGYLGDSLEFEPRGRVRCVAVDVLKKLADNNDSFLTAAYRLTSAGAVELADIVFSLLTSDSYWRSESDYDAPFSHGEIGWRSGQGLTGLQFPLWQGQTNSILGYCQELFGVIGWNFYADGNGVLQATEPPYTQKLPDRVCISDADGCYDVWECNRNRTGKQMRNRVIVQTGKSASTGSGSITLFDPNSISRYGTRSMRITDPLASTTALRQKVAAYVLRDYAWNLQTLTNTIRPDYDTRLKQVFGFRAPARPNLFARASVVEGEKRGKELWSLVSLRHTITHGQWTAAADWIPYAVTPQQPPDFTQLNLVFGSSSQLTAIWSAITDVSLPYVNAYVSTQNEFSGFVFYSQSYADSAAAILALTAGVQVWVYLTSVDIDGIESLPSAILTATPGTIGQSLTCYTITDFAIGSILTDGPDSQGFYTYQFLATWTAPACGFTQSDIRAFVGGSPPTDPDEPDSWPLHDDSWNWWGPERIPEGKTFDGVTDGQLDFTITFRSASALTGLRIYFRIWNSARTRAWRPVEGNYAFCTVA